MNDPIVVRIVVSLLGLIALVALAGTVYLETQELGAGLSGAIATGALGALAGVLSTTNTKADPAMGAAMSAAADAARARQETDLMRLDTSTTHEHERGRTDLVSLGVFLLLLACAAYIVVVMID